MHPVVYCVLDSGLSIEDTVSVLQAHDEGRKQTKLLDLWWNWAESPGVGEGDNGQETFSQDEKRKDSEEGLREELMPTPSLPCSGGTQQWAKLEREQVVWAPARAKTKRPKEGDLRHKT